MQNFLRKQNSYENKKDNMDILKTESVGKDMDTLE